MRLFKRARYVGVALALALGTGACSDQQPAEAEATEQAPKRTGIVSGGSVSSSSSVGGGARVGISTASTGNDEFGAEEVDGMVLITEVPQPAQGGEALVVNGEGNSGEEAEIGDWIVPQSRSLIVIHVDDEGNESEAPEVTVEVEVEETGDVEENDDGTIEITEDTTVETVEVTVVNEESGEETTETVECQNGCEIVETEGETIIEVTIGEESTPVNVEEEIVEEVVEVVEEVAEEQETGGDEEEVAEEVVEEEVAEVEAEEVVEETDPTLEELKALRKDLKTQIRALVHGELRPHRAAIKAERIRIQDGLQALRDARKAAVAKRKDISLKIREVRRSDLDKATRKAQIKELKVERQGYKAEIAGIQVEIKTLKAPLKELRRQWKEDLAGVRKTVNELRTELRSVKKQIRELRKK